MIERGVWEARQGHLLANFRYLGPLRYRLQEILTATILDVKNLVKILTGSNFKGPGAPEGQIRSLSRVGNGIRGGSRWPHQRTPPPFGGFRSSAGTGYSTLLPPPAVISASQAQC